MKTTWQNQHVPTESELMGNLLTDVVIVGAGVAGTTTAYLLALAGVRAIVLEKGEIVQNSTTAYTTGFLVSDIDTDLVDLIKIFGAENAKTIWSSHAHAIDAIERIVKKEKIECEFMRADEYWLATSKNSSKQLRTEAALARSYGFSIAEVPIMNPFGSFDSIHVFKNQAKFHAIKYLAALREAAIQNGAVFFDNTEVVQISGDALVTVTTSDGKKVTARHLVIATYEPFYNPWRLFAKKGMYVSYVYELAVPKAVIPEGLYQDSHNPYHYMRVDQIGGDEDRMIIGGEDRREELPAALKKNFAALLSYFEKQFPGIAYRIVTQWDGPILESIDGIAFIGSYCNKHPNRHIATAFSGNGMTYGYLAGEIISDAILGNKNPYAKIYTPMRRHITFWGIVIKTRDYVGEFFGAYLKNIFKKKHS